MANKGKFRYVKLAVLVAVWIDTTRRLREELQNQTPKKNSQEKQGL